MGLLPSGASPTPKQNPRRKSRLPTAPGTTKTAAARLHVAESWVAARIAVDAHGYTTLNQTVYWTQYREDGDALTSSNAVSILACRARKGEFQIERHE
jgi:hypothetical protein